jgi:hypothetical protein
MVSRPIIPEDVRRLIMTAIPSVPYLEALLLLRSAGAAGLDAATLAAGLYVSTKSAGGLLTLLCEAGVAERLPAPGQVRYAPPAPMAALIERLAEVYADNLIGVSMLIHSTSARLRRSS